MTCGKFGPARAALTASVIVTSHVNFHRGRLHLPVEDDGTTTDRTTIEELVLRRSHLVVIDEIDTFQRTVIDQAARGLLLEERGRLGTPLHTLENEFVLATGKINPGVESSVRGMVHHTKFLASTYVAALDQGLIGQTRSKQGNTRYWLVPRRWDGVQTATLWGLADHEPLTDELTAGFRSLFPGEGAPDENEPSEFAEVRAALAQVTDVGAGPNRLERSRVELETALEHRIPDEADRARFIDRVLQRTLLERIRGHLRQFVYDAPHLAGVGVPIASEIAETLGPYSRWRVHPNGPLGRLLFAFRQQVDPSGRQPAKLSAAAFGGDPHTYTTTIGDITSLCRAGVRRPVLGLSATAYFPMAPHHHVHAEPRWWVSDIGISDVSIHPVRVIDSQRQPIKVSGRSGQDRDRALRDLAAGLWTSRLSNELARLANEDKDRRRILLATTSYQGARVVAQGLVRGGADPGRICLAIRPTASFVGDTTAPTASDLIDPIAQRPAGGWHELRADQLEEFPGLGGDVDILIAPLARVERGLNIIGADNRSALGSIWLLVRPMPVVDEPTELLAHVNAHPLAADANDRLLASSRPSRPADILDERVQLAGRHFEDIVSSLPYFRAMPMPVQLSIAAGTMNGLIQLVGRARRGGTPARVHLADAAMLDSNGGPTFASLISRLRTHWESTGQLSMMQELYGTTLDAFFTFADDEAAKHELPEGDAEC
jgi:hypothetical protein